jgi:acetate kinase
VRLIGVGHRVVHGGLQFGHPVRVDAAIAAQLAQYVPLAPLHQPHNLAPIHDLLERWPDLPQVACFDTAFHRTNADLEQMFGLPQPMFAQGLRRYGFHGLSYEYIAERAAAVLGPRGRRTHAGPAPGQWRQHLRAARRLQCGHHDGLHRGRWPADGHAQRLARPRPGAAPDGAARHGRELSAAAAVQRVRPARRVRAVERHAHAAGLRSPRARLAVDLFCYRIRREIGALAAVLGGVDAIVFTAGIGANSPLIRARVLQDAAWLGVDCDEAANAAGGPGDQQRDIAYRGAVDPD